LALSVLNENAFVNAGVVYAKTLRDYREVPKDFVDEITLYDGSH
jgi:hypothetical protein